MTTEYITLHETERPDALAILNNGRRIGYAEFASHIRKVTHALRGLGLPPGTRAAIHCADPYFHWLLRLACEQLRVVTAMVEVPDGPDISAFLREFDVVLSVKNFPSGAVRHHSITEAWLQDVLESGEEDRSPAPERRPDDPVRIVLTSGTTGTPKRLLYTRHIHEAHIDRVLWFAGLTHRSRYLLALPLAVSGLAACIRAGGTVVLERRMSLAEAIAAHGITHTTLPPLGLKRLLDELPADFVKPRHLMIWSFGAPISMTLREKALARLASDICDIYASNEADSISSIRGRPAGEIGCIFPGVRVEVVDEHDRPLPFGQAGRIRVRTDCMVTGYMDFPKAVGRIFKDGWFYAGDLGILHDAHRLQVLGRSDDILNIGWRKIAPEMIEERILRLGDVADVGVCAVPNRDGIEELCIAITGQRSSDAVLLQRITDALRDLQLGRFHVIKLPTIPRTAIGKLQRKMLKEIAATMHARPSAGVE